MTPTTAKKNISKKEVLPVSMEAPVFNIQGKKTGTLSLPENIFGLPWNPDLVHQVVVSMQSNARGNVAHTKDRGEVRGGGKKPWRQKGTGRARHGSRRSPIWVGGGITHGPRNDKEYGRKINQKMRQKALLVALSRKYKDGEIIFVSGLEMQAPKTKEARAIVSALSTTAGFSALLGKKKNAALIALPQANKATAKSFANFGNIQAVQLSHLNPVSVLSNKYVIMAQPDEAVEVLSKKKVVKK